MLAIVHGCTKFHDYIFGQAEVIVGTDHRPLVPILNQPLHQCPLRLQRMRLTLLCYPIKLAYKPGKDLFLADNLSHFPSTVSKCKATALFQVNVLEFVSASEPHLKSILAATNNNTIPSKLGEYALASWPDKKHEVSEAIHPYWSYQEEIHAQDGLLFRSNKVIIPSSMKSEILALLHVAHPGADKMKARARSVMFWPCLASDIEECCRNGGMCQKHQPRNAKMPLLSHEVPNLSWEAVGIDLFFYGG